MKLKNNMRLISGVMIGESNYTRTSLNEWIQEVKPKGINPFQFLQEMFTWIKVIKRHIGLAIQN